MNSYFSSSYSKRKQKNSQSSANLVCYGMSLTRKPSL